jgi:ATP-dependent protease ClpP protease subunit
MNNLKQGIFMRKMEAGATEVVISIIGVIGWDVAYRELMGMLKSIPDSVGRVVFDIYSPGGDVWEGNGIVQAIGAMKQETVARVQVAASMATLIAVACKTREIAANGRWLIHNPWTQVAGDAASLEKRAKELRDCEIEAAAFYAARTGKTSEEMIKLMAEERWLTPAESKELGFVQNINDPFNASDYSEVKAEIVKAGKWPKALVEILAESEAIKPEENKNGNANATGSASEESQPVAAPVNTTDEIKIATDAGIAIGRAEGEKTRSDEHEKFIEQLADRDAVIAKHQSAKDKAEAHTKAVKAEYDEKIVGLNRQIAELIEKHNGKVAELTKQAEVAATKFNEEISKINKCLAEANDRNGKLLGGGMSFEPTGPETWEEAMQFCKGDYEAAVKKYPKLRDAYQQQHKRK